MIGGPVPDTRIVRSQSTGLRSGEELPERAGGGDVSSRQTQSEGVCKGRSWWLVSSIAHIISRRTWTHSERTPTAPEFLAHLMSLGTYAICCSLIQVLSPLSRASS
jgi:hypothetical protein